MNSVAEEILKNILQVLDEQAKKNEIKVLLYLKKHDASDTLMWKSTPALVGLRAKTGLKC